MQLAGDVAADHDLRVDDDVDAAALAGQLVGDRVDQEGHVVGDHLDDGVAARPAVLLDGRGVHPDVGGALRAVLGQPVVREGGSEDVDRVAVGQVLGGGVQVVALEEREHGVPVRACPCPSSRSAGAPRPGCSQLPGRPCRAARPWLRPAWSALSSGSCRAPLRDVEGSTVSDPEVGARRGVSGLCRRYAARRDERGLIGRIRRARRV